MLSAPAPCPITSLCHTTHWKKRQPFVNVRLLLLVVTMVCLLVPVSFNVPSASASQVPGSGFDPAQMMTGEPVSGEFNGDVSENGEPQLDGEMETGSDTVADDLAKNGSTQLTIPHALPSWNAPNHFTVLVLGDDDKNSAVQTMLSHQIWTVLKEGNYSLPLTPSPMQYKNDGLLLNESEQRMVSAKRFLLKGLDYMGERDYRRATEEFERALYFYRQSYPFTEDNELYGTILFSQWHVANILGRGDQSPKSKAMWCDYVGAMMDMGQGLQVRRLVNTSLDCDWDVSDPQPQTLPMLKLQSPKAKGKKAAATVTPVDMPPPSTTGETIEITSDPLGALVFVDGHYRGISPLTINNFRKGSHLITLTKEGWRRANHNISLGSGDALNSGGYGSSDSEKTIKQSLRPGVFHHLWADLTPLVVKSKTQKLDPGELSTIARAAEALEVKGLLLVHVEPIPGQDNSHSYRTLWYSSNPSQLDHMAGTLENNKQGIEMAARAILLKHLGLDPASLEEPASPKPVLYKLAPIPLENRVDSAQVEGIQ